MSEDPNFGDGLLDGLQEALAWKRGEIALPVRRVDPMPPDRVRTIYKSVATSAKDFERRFHIPAGTLNNWLQGRRRPDPASCAYLTVIARDPEAVERALRKEDLAPS